MIEAHTVDAWTRMADRRTAAYYNSTILGGLAAPLFLWLAGLGVALSAASAARRAGNRAAGMTVVVRRGLEIFVLAFLFRLQAFLVSPGSHPVTLFRVDILNIMGPSMAMAGLMWGLISTPALLVIAYAVLAIAVAMLTPPVRLSPLVGALPTWMQWYIRPFGDLTMFTAFPWAGFVFAGAACGVWLAAARDEIKERQLHVWFAVAGAAIVWLGFYTASLPSIYRQSSFWTSSPAYFAFRIGLMMTLLSMLYALGVPLERRGVVWRPLARFGRSSLFVYWIHVELVYGYATWPIRRRLPLPLTFVAYALFVLLMYAAVVVKDRVMEARRIRHSSPEPHTAPA